MTIKVNKPKNSVKTKNKKDNVEIEETTITLKKSKKQVQIKNVYLYEWEDFNIDNFKEDAAICDIDYIIKTKNSRDYKDYSSKQLALISYNAKVEIDISTYPMLFSDLNPLKRIYTFDIPLKLLSFFKRKITFKINEFWIPEKVTMPILDRFLSDNWITKPVWDSWKYKAEVDKNMSFLQFALDISNGYQKSIIIEWWLEWHYSWNYATFMTKNLFKEFTDDYNINNKLNIVADNFKWMDDLSSEELEHIISNPDVFVKQLNKHIVKNEEDNE